MSKVNAAEWKTLCESFGNRCAGCGTTLYITRDHITPTSKGGPDVIENLQPLCHTCNTSKGDRTIDYRSAARAGIYLRTPTSKEYRDFGRPKLLVDPKSYSVVLPPELGTWGKHRRGGLSATIREALTLLKAEAEREAANVTG